MVLLLWILFPICVLFISAILHCLIFAANWECADLLALSYVMFSCVFVTFSYNVRSQVWYLIVWIPDISLLIFITNKARSEQSSHTPGGSHQRMLHFHRKDKLVKNFIILNQVVAEKTLMINVHMCYI